MPHEIRSLSIDDIATFLAPLIDIFECDEISLTGFAKNHEKIIKKLKQTGRPVLLRAKGEAVLICDATLYFDLEQKRRCMMSRVKSVEEALQVGRVAVADPRIIALQEAQEQTAHLQSRIKEAHWNMDEARSCAEKLEKELTLVQKRADDLKAALGAAL